MTVEQLIAYIRAYDIVTIINQDSETIFESPCVRIREQSRTDLLKLKIETIDTSGNIRIHVTE